MTVSPGQWLQGVASLTIENLTLGGTASNAIRMVGDGNAHQWPYNYVYSNQAHFITIPTTAGTGPPTPYWAMAVVEDRTDVGGNYTSSSGDGSPAAGVIAFIPLGTSISDRYFCVGNGSIAAISNLAFTKGGTFRVVLIAANNETNARRLASVSTAPGSTDYHFDSDGNNASGGLAGLGSSATANGLIGARVKVTALSRTAGNWSYRQNVSASVSIRPTHGGVGGLVNPKQLKIAWDDDVAGATPAEVQRVTPNTTGDATTATIPIDTDFGQVVGGTQYYTHVGVGPYLGDGTTPTAEKAEVYTSGTNDSADSEEAAFVFPAADAFVEEVLGGANRCGTPNGNATVIASPWPGFAGAVDFDGGTDMIYYPTTTYLPLTGGWTIDIKVRRDRLGVEETILAQYEGFTTALPRGAFLLIRFLTGNVLNVLIRNNAGVQRSFSSTSQPGIGLHDIAVDWDGANIRIYIDGVHDGTQAETTGPTQNPEVALTLGGRALTNVNYDGVIGNVRISNVARYAGSNYTPQVGPYALDANTTHYWKNEALANPSPPGAVIVDDISVNNRDGTLVGTVPPSLQPSPFSGGGNALYFDGVDRDSNSCGIIDGTAVGVSTASGSMKLKAKIRRSRTGLIEVIAGKWASSNVTHNYVLYIDAAGKLTFLMKDSTPASITAVGTTTLTSGVNYEVEGEWTGTALNVKVNGVQEGTTPALTTLQAPDGVTPFYAGRDAETVAAPAPFPFQGYMKDLELTIGGVVALSWPMTALTTSLSGVTTTSASRIRTTSADQLASAAIQLSQDGVLTGSVPAAVPTNPGVSTWSSSGYTTTQDIFKRRGTVNTTDAIPYLQTYIFDAYGAPLVGPATGDFILSTQRVSDSGVVDSQTMDTDANGRIRWNFTVAATSAAFNRFVKAAVTRATGSHVATGPDNAISPPASFMQGGPNALYAGPYPAYARKVVVTGTGFSTAKEPTATDSSVFGVNSEIIFEDMWTGALTNAALDGNGVPTGPGSRNFVIPNSAKAKLTTEINEGSVRVINVGEYNAKTVAGIPIDLSGAEVLEGRRALWDNTSTVVIDSGTNLSVATRLDAPLGYASGSNSFDTIGAPTDPSSFTYYQGWKDTAAGNEATEDTTGFLLTTDQTNVGFQTDTGNFGYFRQPIAWVNPDLSLALKLTPRVVQSDPALVVRHGIKVFRVTSDAYTNPTMGFADVHPDEAPIYVVYGLNNDGSQTQITQGAATPIGNPATTADYFFDVTVPANYFAISVFCSGRVSGSPVAGGSQSFLQVGYTFDAVAFATGLPFK